MWVRPIGDFLVEEGLISQEQLAKALLKQREYRSLKVGQILLRTGAVTSAQLDDVVASQGQDLADKTRGVRRKIGEIMIEKGYISASQLTAALEQQVRLARMRLGEILVELGYISRERLEEVIQRQLESVGDDVTRLVT